MREKAMIDYEDAGHALQGWLVHDSALNQPAPGILVFHEFMGLGAYLERVLEKLAALGYVVMAADMYGRDIRPENTQAALYHSRPLRSDRLAMRRRAVAAFECLQCMPAVESGKIAAIGYSFGGCSALELARSGAGLKAAISFYGYLDAPLSAVPGTIRARLLVFHGMHDPVVPGAELAAFRREMAAAGAHSRVVTYADAGHGFCNRQMDGSQHPWNRYSQSHDQRSWQVLVAFLSEVMKI